jgi:hypothetical protein
LVVPLKGPPEDWRGDDEGETMLTGEYVPLIRGTFLDCCWACLLPDDEVMIAARLGTELEFGTLLRGSCWELVRF